MGRLVMTLTGILSCFVSDSLPERTVLDLEPNPAVFSDPSGAGAVGEASPGFGNDHRAVILLKHDGNRIEINDAPSQQDIAAIHSLYGRDKGLAALKLLQKAGGMVTPDFRRLYPESTGADGFFGCLG